MQDALQKVTGLTIVVKLEVTATAAPLSASGTGTSSNPAVERRKNLMKLPLFQKAGEVLGAQIWHVDEDFKPEARQSPATTSQEADDPDEN